MKVYNILLILLLIMSPQLYSVQLEERIEIDLGRSGNEDRIDYPKSISFEDDLLIVIKNYEQGKSLKINIGDDVEIDTSNIVKFKSGNDYEVHIDRSGLIAALDSKTVKLPFALNVAYEDSILLDKIIVSREDPKVFANVNPPETPQNLLDKLTAIGIILLILSLINEKITGLIRKSTGHLTEIFPSTKRFVSKPAQKEVNPEMHERMKEQQVILFSIFMGCVVAFATNADLFSLFQSPDPTTVLFSPNWDSKVGWKLLGILCTGIFLSFGSKFFHDLLDTLLQIKNLKRKLNDPQTYQTGSVQELDAHLIKVTGGEVVKSAVNEHKKTMIAMDNVASIGMGLKEVDGEEVMAAVVHVKDKDSRFIPDTLDITLPNGKTHQVPVETITDVGDVELHNTISPGLGIGNLENNETGTFGCVLFDKFKEEELILTCYHVLNAKHNWDLFQPKREKFQKVVNRKNENEALGTLVYGIRNTHLDIALARPLDGVILNDKVQTLGKVKGVKKVSNFDLKTQVTFKGTKSSNPPTGFIVNMEHTLSDMPYPDQNWALDDLIVLSSDTSGNGQAISKPGDSGSLVMTEHDRKAIGIIVAGTKKFSYAISITTILDHLKMELA